MKFTRLGEVRSFSFFCGGCVMKDLLVSAKPVARSIPSSSTDVLSFISEKLFRLISLKNAGALTY